MKKEFIKYAGAIAICFSVVGIVSAASTISTNISTGGTLDVTGATTLSSTLTVSGASTLSSTLGVTGLSTLTYASTTALTVSDSASTTALVINGGTSVGGLVTGTCAFVARTITASSTGHVDCTATGVRAGDTIFVTATSSLDANFVIQAASSSATNNINMRIFNSGYPTAPTGDSIAGPASVYFWAVR